MEKPIESFNNVISRLKHQCEKKFYRKGHKLFTTPGKIYFSESGVAAAYMVKSHAFYSFANGPFIMGINSLLINSDAKWEVVFLNDTNVYSANRKMYMDSLSENALWQDVSTVQAYYFELIHNTRVALVQKGAYPVIRNLIIEYSHLPEQAKKHMKLQSYISSKGLISRSNVMRVLAVLRKEKFIMMSQGDLIAIDYIPENI